MHAIVALIQTLFACCKRTATVNRLLYQGPKIVHSFGQSLSVHLSAVHPDDMGEA